MTFGMLIQRWLPAFSGISIMRWPIGSSSLLPSIGAKKVSHLSPRHGVGFDDNDVGPRFDRREAKPLLFWTVQRI
jgi:hypothetical protein